MLQTIEGSRLPLPNLVNRAASLIQDPGLPTRLDAQRGFDYGTAAKPKEAKVRRASVGAKSQTGDRIVLLTKHVNRTGKDHCKA